MVKPSATIPQSQRFDAFKLAASGDTLAGRLDVAGRQRIADRLAATPGPANVAWQISGGNDELGRPMLTVTIDGVLPLVCQRCLQPFDTHIEQRSGLLLARDEAELERLDAQEAEVLLAATLLDAVTLIEDEILLSLPLAPRHADAQCATAPARTSEAGTTEPARSAASPFAPLAALKKGTRGTFEE